MLFLSLFVVSDTQCGGEDAEGREGEEGKEQRKAHLWKGLRPDPRSVLAAFTQELSLGSTVFAWP